MRKLVLALSVVLAASPALADYRHRPRYSPPPQHHHHRGGVNPWVAGAVGLGILGAGAYMYNRPARQCWNEVVIDPYGRQLFDQYGRPVLQVVCQ
jgi:hypothetical protein